MEFVNNTIFHSGIGPFRVRTGFFVIDLTSLPNFLRRVLEAVVLLVEGFTLGFDFIVDILVPFFILKTFHCLLLPLVVFFFCLPCLSSHSTTKHTFS